MKKLFILAGILSAATIVNAQIVTGRSSSITRVENKSDNYSRWQFEFTSHTIDSDYDPYIGFSAGFIKGINLTGGKLPLFIEVGGEVGASYYDEDYGWGDNEEDILVSMSLPISVSYRLMLSDNIAFQPSIGPNFRFNLYDDMVEDDYVNVFQPGLNGTVAFTFGKFYLGYRYTTHFSSTFDSKYLDNGYTHTLQLGIQW